MCRVDSRYKRDPFMEWNQQKVSSPSKFEINHNKLMLVKILTSAFFVSFRNIYLQTQWNRCLETVSRHGQISWRHMWMCLKDIGYLEDISITFPRHSKTCRVSWRHFRSSWSGMSHDMWLWTLNITSTSFTSSEIINCQPVFEAIFN